MSVQFGRWNFEGQVLARKYIEKVSATLAPYGPDSNEKYANHGVTILYRAFHTTNESHREIQPHVTASGAVITWDGRLDNRAALISELRGLLKTNAQRHQLVAANFASINSAHEFTDLEIVAGSYEKWGTGCLGKLIGDWALSIWNPRERSVLLAIDPTGTKHLYYSIENDHVTWSTILDPLVLYAGHTFQICEEYVAGWFATGFPAAHLTPYVGVHAVAPSCCVLLRPWRGGVQRTVCKYWDFDPGKRIRYRTDAEYEEHFRTVFAQAVKRRLRSDRPVLAELSGGIDSSSVVCMADLVIARGEAHCPCLDTITWYDESLPNWGEISGFTKVEEKRGRSGHHINAAALRVDHSPIPFGAEFLSDRFAATPIPNSRTPEVLGQNSAYIRSQEYRITLSGIGGGEVTGDGVPTPTPEFRNLLARARFITLTRQLSAWAAKMQKSRFPLLWEAVRGFFPLVLQDLPEYVNPAAPWLHAAFVRRNRTALRDYPFRVMLFGPLPSFQHSLRTIGAVRKLLATFMPEPGLVREIRFPYLDRDLWEFASAIPREQIVRVGQRRSLMRRGLVGIVPDEVLNRRKREASPQEVKKDMRTEWPDSVEIGCHIAIGALGIVAPDRFLESLQKARQNEEVSVPSLKRTMLLESWLRHLAIHGVLSGSVVAKIQDTSSSVEAQQLRAPTQPKNLASYVCKNLDKKGGENHEIRNSGTDGIDACDQCHSGILYSDAEGECISSFGRTANKQ